MADFRFFKMAAAAIFDFGNFKFLTLFFAVCGNKVVCCFDKVERCFDTVAGVDGV